MSDRLRYVSTMQWRRHDNTDNWYLPTNNQYRGVWVKGFGNFGNQGSQGAFAGYTSHILGAMAGLLLPWK